MKPPREIKKRCCICGTKKSKTWTPLKGKCEACGASCAAWSEAHSPEVCAFHKRP